MERFTREQIAVLRPDGYLAWALTGRTEQKDWFAASGKVDELIDQAIRQRDMVRSAGIRIEWHVAEKHAADSIRKLLEGNGISEIAVIHTSARPLVP
ncbi:hypothetical protein [Corallococcus exercitus]|uniref:hypothetical protein n=1 Tax=Corallococcus exercitus TaxID=2316736 RepID=UPI0035D4F6DB